MKTQLKKVISKIANFQPKNKQVIKESKRVRIDVSQPVYSKDKSRFFKTAWEEEKKQLFFS